MQDLLVPAGLIIGCLMAVLAILGFTQRMATKTDIGSCTEAIRELARQVREQNGRIGKAEVWILEHGKWAGERHGDIEHRLRTVEKLYDGPERRRYNGPERRRMLRDE